MAIASFRRLKAGARLGADLTVAHPVCETRGRHPVYAVWNHDAWCPMACKVFRSMKQAEREFEVLSSLQHPNVVRPLGVRRPGHLLMEFLAGPTLDQHLAGLPGGRMSLSDALRTTIHLGGAVHHMHMRGYLHLDLKPGNVAVVDDRPILFDFGTARPISGSRPGHVVGTNPYLAPEEACLQTTTPAADVWGLGVILFELLTGALPFPEETRRDLYPQLIGAAAPLRRLRPGVPTQLATLVEACLSADPDARPTLPKLLPKLHAFIRTGPSMWPANLDIAA